MEKPDFIKDVLPLKDKLYRLALRITENKEDAADIVQETMIKAWKLTEENRHIQSMEAWCMTVARNMSLDKTEKMKTTHSEKTENYDPADEETPHTRLENRESGNILSALMRKLPEKQKTAMQLRDIEGMSYKEIAEIMQIGESDVKVSIFRARQKIKEEYLKLINYGL